MDVHFSSGEDVLGKEGNEEDDKGDAESRDERMIKRTSCEV